jgi:hypothetical protein
MAKYIALAENVPECPPLDGVNVTREIKKADSASPQEELKLSEFLILTALWMLFGFMLWYYFSAFHGIPARLLSDSILSQVLGSDFSRIVAEPNQRFLFQVETWIPFVFPDETTENLGFIINPLIFGYGLPVLFGLVMASGVAGVRKLVILLIGYAVISLVQVWGVVWGSLKVLAFNFGDQTHAVVQAHGISDSVIVMGYQVGTLILPALAPILVWILTNRPLVEQLVGWGPDQSRQNRNP